MLFILQVTASTSGVTLTSVTVTLTPDPVTGLLSRGYVEPCTQSNIQSNLLFHPYNGHPDQVFSK